VPPQDKSTDIRWRQRFSNYKKALSQLRRFMKKKELNELEEQGLIQSFEYTHELAWKTVKDFFESRGNSTIFGSKDATREAFKAGLIEDGENWMAMIRDRNQTSHTYNIETAKKIVSNIRKLFFSLFELLETKLQNLQDDEQLK
jgi:nucleotidyltransferase substrate binding protein (TIGR01987 family)